jgi:acyl-CoA synthetase (AMP-forming)/AMP-acid ligase II
MEERTMLPELPRADSYLSLYAEEKGLTPAWYEGERCITFAKADEHVSDLARALLHHGVKHGDRIAVYGKPGIDFMALFLAISSVGCIYVGLNPRYTASELAVVFDDCKPGVVFNLLNREPAHAEKIDGLLSSRPSIRVVAGSELHKFSSGGQVISQAALKQARLAVRPGDTALLVYTSGSTGKPKGAKLTHRGITFIGRVANAPEHFGVEGQGRNLCNLPINHVGCVVDTCTNSLIGGATLVFQADFDPNAMLCAIERHGLTLVGGVPVMFLAMTQTLRFASTSFSSLQKVVLAGNSPPLPLVQLLQQVMGCTVMNGYGLTEAMGFSTFTQADDPPEAVAHTVGRFAPEIEWRLQDDEIQMRGDWLFAGYYGRPEATAAAFTEDGWFCTGDLATLTPEGRLRLTGRRQEVFKSGGYNVYPLEIEQALEGLPGVVMAVVVPRPDPTFAEVGHAFVVTQPGVDVGSLTTALRDVLANYKIPKHIEGIQEMPMLPVGKVDRLALRARVRQLALEQSPAEDQAP